MRDRYINTNHEPPASVMWIMFLISAFWITACAYDYYEFKKTQELILEGEK
jgi:hypothetical protein